MVPKFSGAMNPQRLIKSLPNIRPKSLVPFETPISSQISTLRATARLLFPSNYNIKFSQFIGSNRLSKTPFTSLDLKQLSHSLDFEATRYHCDPLGGYLFVNFGLDGSSYKNTAVVFPDGVLVTWFMDRDQEAQIAKWILKTTINCASLSPTRGKRTEAITVDQFLSSELSESINVSELNEDTTGSQLANGGDSIMLTRFESERSNDILAVSMALASAVRMNVIEAYLQEHISFGHNEISKLLQRMNNWKLSRVSETIFKSEQLVHNWRYFLTQNGVDDVPDCLWDYGELDKLYEQVMKNFDVHKRFNDINTDLTYYSEFLATCGEHVRHKYSSRLEKIIIGIIAIEAGIALRHLLIDMFGENNSDAVGIVPVVSDTQ